MEIYRLEEWRERAMAGLELGLKDRHGEPVAEVLDQDDQIAYLREEHRGLRAWRLGRVRRVRVRPRRPAQLPRVPRSLAGPYGGAGRVGLEFRIRSLNRGLGHHCVAPEF